VRPVKLLNLVRRTAAAFFPALARPDDDFAAEVLPQAESDLYMKMDRRDRAHACEVARALETRASSSLLLRAALLHDVGKYEAQYNPLERIAVHLYTPDLPPEPRLKGLRGAWQRRRYHERYGARLILEGGGDPAVADIVARHHRPDGHPEATALKAVEELF
jgi:putative nucleotidyltransferase with HDIG domain